MGRANRAAIIAHLDAQTVCIRRNGEVHAYGTKRGTNRTGWYFAGFADHILDAIAAQA